MLKPAIEVFVRHQQGESDTVFIIGIVIRLQVDIEHFIRPTFNWAAIYRRSKKADGPYTARKHSLALEKTFIFMQAEKG